MRNSENEKLMLPDDFLEEIKDGERHFIGDLLDDEPEDEDEDE